METLVRLAEQARSGDRLALETLLKRSAPILHAAARARLGDSLAADGAVVDSLTRIARGVRGLKTADAYPQWAYRIAARCALAVARRPDLRLVDPAAADRHPAPTHGPVDTLVAAERRQRVRDEIRSLARRLREPVYLHYVEGLEQRAIARLLDTSLATVNRRLRRALEILRSRLGESR
ncbi:MAG: sigma-70 family RNA polymerase sigma factor [Planctomycetota bacterium]|nr:sigma-70 family RNA polymerase sigma factor [Planctomycetota bacterium]